MEITGCKFRENVANESGGALVNNGKINLMNAVFYRNHAKEGWGGAIITSDEAVVEATKTVFRDNVSKEKGGAILAYNPNNLKLNNCIIENNKPNDIN